MPRQPVRDRCPPAHRRPRVLEAPSGTLIAYAAAPGRAVDDDSRDHSLYSLALAEEIKRPGLRVEDVFKRVRRRVRVATSGQQVPWESSSLEGDFRFARTTTGDGDTADTNTAPVTPVRIDDGAPPTPAAPPTPSELETLYEELAGDRTRRGLAGWATLGAAGVALGGGLGARRSLSRRSCRRRSSAATSGRSDPGRRCSASPWRSG